MREAVLAKYGNRCAYCGCNLTLATMQVDHIEPLRRGDVGEKSHLNNLTNYNPSCRSCNYYKATYTIEQFRERFDLMMHNLVRQSTVKALLRYELITFETNPVEFYFEKLAREGEKQ